MERNSGERIFNGAIGAVNRNKLNKARKAACEAARRFFDQGFDEEEIVALLMGAMETAPNYVPHMRRFFELQILRAIREIKVERAVRKGKK